MSISYISNYYRLLSTVKEQPSPAIVDTSAQPLTSLAPANSASTEKVKGVNGSIAGQPLLSGESLVATQQLSDMPTVPWPEGMTLMQFGPVIDGETLRTKLEAEFHAAAVRNNPFHDVRLPSNSVALFQDHLPNINLQGKMLAVTFPEYVQHIDVNQTASQITQDADGTIHGPKGATLTLIDRPTDT